MTQLYSPKDVIDANLCIGCGVCVAQAAAASMQFDQYGQLKPSGSKNWLQTPTEAFSKSCPFSPLAKNESEIAEELFNKAPHISSGLGRFEAAYVGYAAEADFRMQGSSGGMVTWVATELLRKGLVTGVIHVTAVEDPQQHGSYFQYKLSKTEAEVRRGAKSRYYPNELSKVLKIIQEQPGRYAVVGVPCFIKAINLLRQNNAVYGDSIAFTLGLFCGHMKSARFVESFAWQMNVPVSEVAKVEFRYKDPNRPANWYNAMLTLKNGTTINKDWWQLADGDWGAGFFMNNACNYCDDVVAETADISFGDAWVEPYSSDGKGTNVVVVRSKQVAGLLDEAIATGRLHLQAVDSNFVEQTQAAGFRQRREGLAYRLVWAPPALPLRKRVQPNAQTPAAQRKCIYRLRYAVSKWSHRFFSFARRVHLHGIYTRWAVLAAALYHGLAYHRGKIGEITKRFVQLKKS